MKITTLSRRGTPAHVVLDATRRNRAKSARGSVLAIGLLSAMAVFSIVSFTRSAHAIDSSCVSLDSYSNNAFNFWVNNCGVKVNIKFVVPGTVCGTGCGATVAAGGRETTTKFLGAQYIWAVCEYPQLIDRNWVGQNQYSCH